MTTFDSLYAQKMFMQNAADYMGADVIVLSNEQEPVVRGVLIFWTEISQAGQMAPVVRYSDGPDIKEVIVLGHILPYTDELWGLIGGWPSVEAWNMFGAIRNMYDKMRRMHKD
jgi:hypothetical protein